MPFLFIALCITILVSEFYLVYTFCMKPTYKNKLTNFIFKYLFTAIAIIILLAVIIYLLLLDPLVFIMWLLGAACFVLFAITILWQDAGLAIVTGAFTLIFLGISVSLNFKSLETKLPTEEVILNDYFVEDKNKQEKVTIIELSEINGKTKSYIIQTYNSDIELPFFYDDIDEYVTEDIEKNYITITNTEIKDYDLLSLFEFKKPDISVKKTYTLHVNENDILYN